MPSHAFLPIDASLADLSAPVAGGARPAQAPPGDSLDGLMLAVKDVFDVAGLPTHAGSPQWCSDPHPPTETAPAVAALLDHGATLRGKTVCCELAFSLMGRNEHYPRPLNHAAPDRLTGGSSSGAAAAVGWGEASLSVCTDTGGSIRGPASFCGLMGLRTTHGRVPMAGCVPLAPSFDTGGWFARDPAAYRATALASLEGPHAPLSPKPRARTLAALDALVDPAAAPEWSRIRAQALDALGPSVPLDIGACLNDLYWCFRRLQAIEAWAMHGPHVEERGAGMNADVRARFEWAQGVTPAEHGAAVDLRRAFKAWLTDELEPDDVLVLPTMPGPAPMADSDDADLGDLRERALRLLCVAGLAGLPQLSVPLGTVDGAPFGLSLIGGRNTDVALLDLGTAIMQSAGVQQSVALPH